VGSRQFLVSVAGLGLHHRFALSANASKKYPLVLVAF